jgi:hypothetical protein
MDNYLLADLALMNLNSCFHIYYLLDNVFNVFLNILGIYYIIPSYNSSIKYSNPY